MTFNPFDWPARAPVAVQAPAVTEPQAFLGDVPCK